MSKKTATGKANETAWWRPLTTISPYVQTSKVYVEQFKDELTNKKNISQQRKFLIQKYIEAYTTNKKIIMNKREETSKDIKEAIAEIAKLRKQLAIFSGNENNSNGNGNSSGTNNETNNNEPENISNYPRKLTIKPRTINNQLRIAKQTINKLQPKVNSKQKLSTFKSKSRERIAAINKLKKTIADFEKQQEAEEAKTKREQLELDEQIQNEIEENKKYEEQLLKNPDFEPNTRLNSAKSLLKSLTSKRGLTLSPPSGKNPNPGSFTRSSRIISETPTKPLRSSGRYPTRLENEIDYGVLQFQNPQNVVNAHRKLQSFPSLLGRPSSVPSTRRTLKQNASTPSVLQQRLPRL
jgi:hypothetical protein